MSIAKIGAAVAAVALLLVFAVPGSAGAGWHHRAYPPFARIYPHYPWGYPQDLRWGRSLPMFAETVYKNNRYHTRYYYQMPPYWHCCW